MESASEIAYIAGEFQYHSGDSRADISSFLQWAEEFEAIRKVDEHGVETYGGQDYISAIWDFARAKIGEPRPQDSERQVPPDEDGRNSERAEWAEVALLAFEDRTGCDREDSVCDLICDLMHWCDRNATDIGLQLRRARGMYEDEITEPDTDPNEIEPFESGDVEEGDVEEFTRTLNHTVAAINSPAPTQPQPPEDVPF